MTSIMWPTRSRVSHSVERVWTFQFFGSSTIRVNLARSRRITLRTVGLDSAANGLTGAITAVLISSFPSQEAIPDHGHQCPAPVVAVVGTTMGGNVASSLSRLTWNQGGRLNDEPSDSTASSMVNPGP